MPITGAEPNSCEPVVNFIAALGCVMPSIALAQPLLRPKRVGIPMAVQEADPEGQARVAAFIKEFGRLGWSAGRNKSLSPNSNTRSVSGGRSWV